MSDHTDPTDAWPATPPSTDLFADDLLADETALVTGGGTGIGKAIALSMADDGADVAIASRDMDHLAPVAEEIETRGVDACATTVDVREPDEVAQMAESPTLLRRLRIRSWTNWARSPSSSTTRARRSSRRPGR